MLVEDLSLPKKLPQKPAPSKRCESSGQDYKQVSGRIGKEKYLTNHRNFWDLRRANSDQSKHIHEMKKMHE